MPAQEEVASNDILKLDQKNSQSNAQSACIYERILSWRRQRSLVPQTLLSVYSLRRILSLGKQKSKSVYIEKSSTYRTEVFSLVALYCSNGYIILRYAGPSNDTRNVLPILRYIPWFVNNDTEGDNDAHHSSDSSGVIKGKGATIQLKLCALTIMANNYSSCARTEAYIVCPLYQ